MAGLPLRNTAEVEILFRDGSRRPKDPSETSNPPLSVRGVENVRHVDVLIVLYLRWFQILIMEGLVIQFGPDPGELGTDPVDSL